jgi:hypothetical protein
MANAATRNNATWVFPRLLSSSRSSLVLWHSTQVRFSQRRTLAAGYSSWPPQSTSTRSPRFPGHPTNRPCSDGHGWHSAPAATGHGYNALLSLLSSIPLGIGTAGPPGVCVVTAAASPPPLPLLIVMIITITTSITAPVRLGIGPRAHARSRREKREERSQKGVARSRSQGYIY